MSIPKTISPPQFTEPIIEIFQEPLPQNNLLIFNLLFNFFSKLNLQQFQIKKPLIELTPKNFCEIFLSQNNLLCIRQGKDSNTFFLNDYLHIKTNQIKLNKQIDFNKLNKSIYEDVFVYHNIYGYLEMKTSKTMYMNESYVSHLKRKIDMMKSPLLYYPPINYNEYENYFINNTIDIELNDGYIDLVNDTLSDLLTELTVISENDKSNNIQEDKINKTFNDIIKHIDNIHLLNYLEYFYSLFMYRETFLDDPYKQINKSNIRKIVLKYLCNKNSTNDDKKTKISISLNLNDDKENKLYNELKNELNQREKEYENEINSSINSKNNKITYLYINTEQMKKENIFNLLSILSLNNNKNKKRNQLIKNENLSKLFDINILAWTYDEQETIKTFQINNVVKLGSIPLQSNQDTKLYIYYLYSKNNN